MRFVRFEHREKEKWSEDTERKNVHSKTIERLVLHNPYTYRWLCLSTIQYVYTVYIKSYKDHETIWSFYGTLKPSNATIRIHKHTHTHRHTHAYWWFFSSLAVVVAVLFRIFRRTTAFITVEAIFFPVFGIYAFAVINCHLFGLSISLSHPFSVEMSFVRSFVWSFFQSVWCFNMNCVCVCVPLHLAVGWLTGWMSIFS